MNFPLQIKYFQQNHTKMVKSIVLLTVLSLICGTFALDTNFSPVLFFTNKENTKTLPKNIISSTIPVKQQEFEQYLNGIRADQKIVILLTDDLSPEDLSIKNVHNERGFQYLASQVSIKQYMPYVENAADNQVTLKARKRYSLTATNEVEPEPSSDARIIIVSLPECDDDSESRFHCIAHIDRACYALSQSEKYKDAVFILTSEMNSHLQEVHSRKARQASAAPPSGGTVKKDNNFIVYFKDLMARDKKSGKDTVIAVNSVTGTKANNEITLEFSGQYNIKLNFQLEEQGYVILNRSKTTVNDKPIATIEVAMPEEFSFSCVSSFYLKMNLDGKDEAEANDGLFFQNLQIQLNFTNDNGPALSKFGDSYDCVGFTSPAIWAGLFITFLLLSIISTGITYIMDIRTVSFYFPVTLQWVFCNKLETSTDTWTNFVISDLLRADVPSQTSILKYYITF